MIRIAIVEDDLGFSKVLNMQLDNYANSKGEQFSVEVFKDGMDFLHAFKADFDLVFMDIDMPMINGMQVAKNMRKKDQDCLLVFVTNLAKYAINGYAVGAIDFVVKPIAYQAFKLKMDRYYETIIQKQNAVNKSLVIKTDSGINKIQIESLRYIEVGGHHLVFHTTNGDFTARGSMREMVEKLDSEDFALCNNCFFVNLAFVNGIVENDVIVEGEKLKISRNKKQNFLKSLAKYNGKYFL